MIIDMHEDLATKVVSQCCLYKVKILKRNVKYLTSDKNKVYFIYSVKYYLIIKCRVVEEKLMI